ncbi:MAG TPA: ABC transporter ATP-binding protein [Candidatus Acidoferrum sp.]|nr:ABC transporter ATP-binding protein [Candidatus Acidoferrum sp.]
MLEVRGLTKRYAGTLAVDHVSFQISPGEILGYVGPNGAGKSTTVKMIIGLLDPSEGMVLFNGRSIREDLAGFQSQIGYVPEEPYLYPYLSGYEYLELTGRLRGMQAAAIQSRIDEFLRLFGLWDDRHTPVSSYSKGMRQKILLSSALLGNPRLLIFDEPLSGLDVTAMLVVRELMQGLAAQGRIVLYSSHVLEVVEKICSRVLILNKGRVAAHDSIQHLRETTQQSSLQAIFSELTREADPREVAGRFLQAMGA